MKTDKILLMFILLAWSMNTYGQKIHLDSLTIAERDSLITKNVNEAMIDWSDLYPKDRVGEIFDLGIWNSGTRFPTKDKNGKILPFKNRRCGYPGYDGNRYFAYFVAFDEEEEREYGEDFDYKFLVLINEYGEVKYPSFGPTASDIEHIKFKKVHKRMMDSLATQIKKSKAQDSTFEAIYSRALAFSKKKEGTISQKKPLPATDRDMIIKGAKNFVAQNSKKKIRILPSEEPITSNNDLSFTPDWTKMMTMDYLDAFVVEVPLFYNKTLSYACKVVVYGENKTPITKETIMQSSLLVEYNRNTREYTQYIIARVWRKELAPVTRKSLFDNLEVKSYLFQANREGEIVACIIDHNEHFSTMRFYNQALPVNDFHNELVIGKHKINFFCMHAF